MKKKFFIMAAVAAVTVQFVGLTGNLWAQCTAGPNYTCNSGNQSVTIGGGPTEINSNVTVGAGGVIHVADMPAISLGSGYAGGTNSTIDIYGQVANNARRNPGKYGTGSNTIEVQSHYTITVYGGGSVQSLGSQNNAEAINVHGFGNIINVEQGGTVYAQNDVALWFQDSMDKNILTDGTVCARGDCRNRVDNSGTIGRANDQANVFGSSAAGAEAGIIFTNRATGSVHGSLNFGAGDDELNFVAGSGVITGSVNGGRGKNTLTLAGDIGERSELKQQVSNFDQLNKEGLAEWTISGNLVNFKDVTVYEGTLILAGDNSGFIGTMTVMNVNTYTDWDGISRSSSGGSLQARAQSLPTTVINNGQMTLTNDTGDDGTYVGQITGDGTLFKIGYGVVTLAPQTGFNDYAGLTTIEQGGLAIYNPNALGIGALEIGGVLGDVGTLYTLASMTLDKVINIGVTGSTTGVINVAEGTTLTNNTGIGGTDTVAIFQKTGTGILELNGYNDFQGVTQIESGTLRVNSNAAGNLSNDIYVRNNAQLEGIGSVGSTTTSVTNAGVVMPGNPKNPYGILTIRGDYEGQPGGQVTINAVLGDDNSAHSTLVIAGTTGYIPNDVRVINNNGAGGKAPYGIPIIKVGDDDPLVASAFRLLYDYKLNDGTTAVVGGTTLYSFKPFYMGAGNGWEFRLLTVLGPDGKPILNPALPLYEAYPAVLAQYMQLGTLQQRVGNRSWESGGGRDIEPRGAWIKMEGQTGRYKAAKSLTDANFDLGYGMLRFGFDLPVLWTDEDSLLIFGIGAHASRFGRATLKSEVGHGNIDVNMEGLDATLTWYGQNGFYTDFQARTSWFDSDLKSDSLVSNHQTLKNDGFGYALGLEAGWEVPLNRSWSLTPQIQAVFTEVDFDTFVDTQNNEVISGKSQSLVGRLGLALNYDNSVTANAGDDRRIRGYVIPNLYHEFLDGTKVSVAGVEFERRNERLWAGLAVGGTLDWDDDNFSIYGELGARTSVENFGDSRQFSGELGFRIGF